MSQTNDTVLENAINGVNGANAGNEPAQTPTVLAPDTTGADDAPATDGANTVELELTLSNIKTWTRPGKDADGNSFNATVYRVFFKESFKGLVKTDTGKSEVDVNYIDFRPGELIDILSDFVPDFAIIVLDKREQYTRGVGSTVNAASILKYFLGAKLMVTREFHAEGECDEDGRVFKSDTWLTYVDDVIPSANNAKRLEKAVDAI